MAEIFLILLTLPLYECCAAQKSFQLKPIPKIEVSGLLNIEQKTFPPFELKTIPPKFGSSNDKSGFDGYKTTWSPAAKTDVSKIPAENQLMMDKCDDAEITGVISGCEFVSLNKWSK